MRVIREDSKVPFVVEAAGLKRVWTDNKDRTWAIPLLRDPDVQHLWEELDEMAQAAQDEDSAYHAGFSQALRHVQAWLYDRFRDPTHGDAPGQWTVTEQLRDTQEWCRRLRGEAEPTQH